MCVEVTQDRAFRISILQIEERARDREQKERKMLFYVLYYYFRLRSMDRASVGDFHAGELTTWRSTEYGVQHSVQSAAAAAPEVQIFNSPSVPDGSYLHSSYQCSCPSLGRAEAEEGAQREVDVNQACVCTEYRGTSSANHVSTSQ